MSIKTWQKEEKCNKSVRVSNLLVAKEEGSSSLHAQMLYPKSVIRS